MPAPANKGLKSSSQHHSDNMIFRFPSADSLPIGALLAEQFLGDDDGNEVQLQQENCHLAAQSSWDPTILASCMPDPIIEPNCISGMTPSFRSGAEQFTAPLLHHSNRGHTMRGDTTTDMTTITENIDTFERRDQLSFTNSQPIALLTLEDPFNSMAFPQNVVSTENTPRTTSSLQQQCQYDHLLSANLVLGCDFPLDNSTPFSNDSNNTSIAFLSPSRERREEMITKSNLQSTRSDFNTTTSAANSFSAFDGLGSKMMMTIDQSPEQTQEQERHNHDHQRSSLTSSSISPVEEHRKQILLMKEQQRSLLEKMNQDVQTHSSSRQLYMELEHRLEKIDQISLPGGELRQESSLCSSFRPYETSKNHMSFPQNGRTRSGGHWGGSSSQGSTPARTNATATATSIFTSAGTGLTIREGGWLLGLESLNLPVVRPKRKRRPKAKDAPKRPLSAYNLFFKDQRVEMLENLEQASTSSSEDSCSSSSDDQPWIWDNALRGNMRDENQPVRKKQKSRGLGFASLARTIAAKWKDIDEETLERYQRRAELEMKLYKEAVREYEERKKQEEKSGQQQ